MTDALPDRSDSVENTNNKLRGDNMKRLLSIFELSKNEQRVVLIVILTLLAIASIGYEWRVRHPPEQPASTTELKPSPNRAKIENQP